MARQLSLVIVAALEPAAPAVPDLKLPEPAMGELERAPPFHLFIETLRVPFGEDWGGETFLYKPVTDRMSVGLFMRAWNEAICASPSCQDRALEAGVELRYRVKPGIDLGLGIGAQKTAGARTAPTVLPRVHLRF